MYERAELNGSQRELEVNAYQLESSDAAGGVILSIARTKHPLCAIAA